MTNITPSFVSLKFVFAGGLLLLLKGMWYKQTNTDIVLLTFYKATVATQKGLTPRYRIQRRVETFEFFFRENETTVFEKLLSTVNHKPMGGLDSWNIYFF